MLATRDVEFITAGQSALQIVWAQFDSPITFTAGSTGLGIGINSTSSIRMRLDDLADTADGAIQNRVNGTQANSNGVQWTLAGTPLWIPPDPPVAPYRFDAAVDEPGDIFWRSNAPSFENFVFEGGATPSPVAVNDPSVPGITAAYDLGAVGTSNAYDPFDGGISISRKDATFEVWFKPDSLAGGDQVIFEVGGAGNGSYISLQDDVLSLFVNGQIDNTSASTTLASSDWTQVVAVIHNTFSAGAPSVDDFVELYVNGQLVSSSASLVDLNDWAGGNQAGIGQEGGNLAADGPIDTTNDVLNSVDFDFAGLIASVEYFVGALDATTILDRYLAITTAVSQLAGDYNASGSVEQGDLDLVLNNWGGPRTAGFVANADGFATDNVDQEELDRVLNNWGSSSAPSFNGVNVPEPAALSLLGLIGLSMLRRRA